MFSQIHSLIKTTIADKTIIVIVIIFNKAVMIAIKNTVIEIPKKPQIYLY